MKLFYTIKCELKLLIVFVVLLKSTSGYYENQPKFITVDGNLVIESALHRNISFTMKGRGAVNINDVNLLNAIRSSSSGGGPYPTYDRRYTVINERLSNLERRINGYNGLIQKVQRLENGTNSNSNDITPNTNKMRQINSRMQRLEEKVDGILTKLTENNCRTYPCQNGGTCVSRYDGFSCQCLSNWEGETCGVDVNECSRFAGTDLGCQNGATCQNTHGGYNCHCRAGWQGLHCTRQTSSCVEGNERELCDHGTCVQVGTAVGYKCICDQGWSTNGISPACSIDINECNDLKPHCSKDPEVICINTPGSFSCGGCPAGFTGNGFYCTDINECEINNGGCSQTPTVPCVNTRGSYHCGTCPSGYEGDGKSCIRAGNTCSRPDFCHPLAQCVQYPNSVVLCNCPAGYTGNGFGPNGCTRTDGCSPNPCMNGGTCVPNGLAWTCRCPPQTIQPNCARMEDRCVPNPCLNGGTCTQTSTGSRCSCAIGFIGTVCETEQRACGGYLNSSSGILKYPADGSSTYQHNTRCVWLIETNITKILNITFTNFHLENSTDCRYDWLQIHDGRSTTYHMLGRFCGNQLPKGGNLMSSHNLLYLWFRSDDTTSHSGFTLSWDSIEPICGGEIESTTFGTILSPGSPGQYPQNRDCVWHISAPAGKRIQLHFFTMKLETHSTCDYDYFAVYAGTNVQDTLLEKFCNTTLPEPLLSPGDDITLQFHSDGVSSDTGFQVHYTIVEGVPGCGGTFTNTKGEFGSPLENGKYQHNLVCDYIIKMPVNVRIKIEFLQFDLEEHSECRFDYLAIYEGKTDQDPIVNKYCGNNLPPRYVSESNVLLIKFKTDSSNANDGFRISYSNVCGSKLTEESGEFTSPNYPRYYETDRICSYDIEAPLGKVILLDFIDFQLEGTSSDCSYDYVQIFDGIQSNSSSVGKYCSDQAPARTISTYNYLHIEFITDSSVSGRGFKANYTFIDSGSGCGGILRSTDQVITPPVSNYGDGYSHNSFCRWLIVAPLGKSVQLTWSTFNIEASSSCSYDWVQIYDNGTNSNSVIGGKYCGENAPPTFTSTENMITIVFKTDSSRNAGGFSASFAFIDTSKSCGGRYYSTTGFVRTPGYPENYMHGKSCEWIISVPTGQQIELIPKVFELESHSECRFDYLEIRNGGNANSPLYGKFCGTSIPEYLTSFSNQIYLKFVSDHSNSHKGFEIEWDGTATGCGGVLTTSKGLITSPNYPDPYGENTVCIWKISVNQGNGIQIIITDIEMERSSSCSFDYLEIFDGQDASANSFGKFCSDNHPLNIESTSNVLYLKMKTDSSDNGRGFSLRYKTTCIKELTGHMGVIESLNFPAPYPPSINCAWTIKATKGNKIFIDFSHFELENADNFHNSEHVCQFDYVQITQMEDTDEISSKKYCNHAPSNFTSLHDVVVIKHVTDSSRQETGFRLEWRIEGCGDIFTKPEGEFTSPNYPNSYPHSTHCEWTIVADYGYSVELTIKDFVMESSDNCLYDGLFVSEKKNETKMLTKLCHPIAKEINVTGQGNELFVKFYSDSSVSAKGFSASYRFVEAKCGTILTAPSGFIYSPNYPTNYGNNITCEWLIKIEENHLIELYIMDFDIENGTNCQHDKLRIYDGGEENENKLLLSHCSNQLPNITKYVSSKNEMLIIFKTDESVGAKGFKLNYTMACGARIIANDTGIISLSETVKHMAKNCTWILETSQPSQHITLTITHLEAGITEEDYMYSEETDRCIEALEILDGDTITSPQKGRYCGIKHPIPIVGSGQFLTVHLATNENYASRLSRVQFIAHYSVYDNACGGSFTSEHGTFASPNYPNSYPLNVECVWNIIASPGNRISISLQSLDITTTDNCHDSYLEIREQEANGKMLGVYCGQNSVTNFTSSNGYWVKFRSGNVTTAKGFIGEYFYDNHVELDGESGKITSPLYPLSLRLKDKTYTWRILVEYGYIITATFKEFTPQGGYSNCNSWLKVYDGYDEDAPLLSEDLCDEVISKSLTSSSNVIYIKLDQSRGYRGTLFALDWIRGDKSSVEKNDTDPICGNKTIVLTDLNQSVNFTSPGYPYGYESNINCSWIITTNYTSYHPRITMEDIDLEQYENCVADYVEIFTSDDLSTWKQLAKRCTYSYEDENTFHGSPYLRIDFRSDYSANKTGFRGSIKLNCGSHLSGPTGIISLNTNDTNANRINMPNHMCMWNITVRQGRTIKFEFEKINLPMTQERCNSAVMLRNGVDENSPLLGVGRYCGITIPEINQTISNKGFVKFNYGSDAGSEFSLRYQEVSPDCGGNIILNRNINSTIITSPNYPNVPFPHSECVWLVMVPSGQFLKYEFIETFDLHDSKDCKSEYLEIRDGSTLGSSIIGTYCKTKPEPYITNNNIMRLKYFTDSVEPNNGFKVKVSIALCGAVYRSPKGKVSSPNYPNTYPPNSLCEYHIVGKSGTYLNITFTTMDLPSGNCSTSDFVEIFAVNPGDTRNRTEISLGKFCGFTIPPIITTMGNEVKIRFKTFGPQSYRGFQLSYNSSEHECGGDIISESGVITSPGYPNIRMYRQFCTWIIQVPKGRRVRIDFDDLDLLPSNYEQYMGFYNSKGYESHIRHIKGGDSSDIIINSTDNTMRIFLSVYEPSSHRGFKLRFSSNESSICDGNLNNLEGTIIGPAFNGSYICEYARDSVPFYFNSNVGTLALTFTDLIVGNKSKPDCSYVSKISVYVDDEDEESNIMGLLCGNVTETAIINSPFINTNIKVIQTTYTGNVSYNLAYKIHKCGELVYNQSDLFIRKPNFTDNYGKVDCAWQIKYLEEQQIKVWFNTLNFKANCDKEYINIYNGPTSKSPKMGKYCETAHVDPVIAHSHMLFVEYHSDSYDRQSNFEVKVEPFTTTCGRKLLNPNFNISSPMTNSQYQNNVECIWEIHATAGFHIGLVFNGRFYLEKSDNCNKDFVEVFDKIGNDWKSFGRVCGRETPRVFNSTGSLMKVVFHSDDTIIADGFNATWEENCGGIFNATTDKQIISSPGYPDQYRNDMNCNYTIIASNENSINLKFLDFELEGYRKNCIFDNVTIYQAMLWNPGEMELKDFYCMDKPEDMRIKSKANIIFKTDNSVKRKGFQFEFSLDECGGLITESSVIESPKLLGTNEYPSQLSCYWNITAPVGKKIRIRFEVFHLEHTDSCHYDYVEIFNGTEANENKRLARLCGNLTLHPPTINIDSHNAVLLMKTDSSFNFGGFSALVIFSDKCDKTLQLSVSNPSITLNEITSAYAPLLDCHYFVSAPVDRMIKVTFEQFHLATCDANHNKSGCVCDFIEIRDGSGPFSDLIGKHCGHTNPTAITSSGPLLWMRLSTDATINSTGFRATFTLQESQCGPLLFNMTEQHTKTLQSPGNEKYLPNLRCVWTLIANESEVIEINFEKMDLQTVGDNGDCSNDMLEIYDDKVKQFVEEGLGEDFIFSGKAANTARYSFYSGIKRPLTHHQYCGNGKPQPYISSSNKVFIKFKTDAETELSGFKLTARVIQNCSRNFTSTQGRVLSQQGTNCEFWITAPENHTISLYFVSLYYNSNCENNGLQIFENGPTGKSVGTYCGYSVPDPIFTTTNSLFIRVKREDNHEGSYDFYYLASDQGPGCGGQIFNYGGIFSSPLYPQNNRNSSDCRWDISVPQNLKVALKFTEFDFGTESTCSSNFLEIIEIAENTDVQTVARKLCGNEIPATYKGNRNVLSVRFKKTVNFSGTGFRIQFIGIHADSDVPTW